MTESEEGGACEGMAHLQAFTAMRQPGNDVVWRMLVLFSLLSSFARQALSLTPDWPRCSRIIWGNVSSRSRATSTWRYRGVEGAFPETAPFSRDQQGRCVSFYACAWTRRQMEIERELRVRSTMPAYRFVCWGPWGDGEGVTTTNSVWTRRYVTAEGSE